MGITALVVGSIGVAASIKSGMDQKKAAGRSASQQREIGRLNQKNILSQSAETYRRTDKNFKQIIGRSKAIVDGSGVRGASRVNYLRGLRAERHSQLDWINKSAKSRGEAAKAGAFASADATSASGSAALTSSLGNAFTQSAGLYSAYNASQKPIGL